MDILLIEATKSTPKVRLQPDGEMLFEGRSLPEDPHGFYSPILNWVKNFTGSKVALEIRLDYLNTSSSKQLYEFLSIIKNTSSIKDIQINWYYEEGDKDALETGKDFEAMTKLTFAFHEFAEVGE